MNTQTATSAAIRAALTPAQHAAFLVALGSSEKTIKDPILGDLPVMYRSDRDCDILKITRARVLLARAPVGSKLAQVYAVHVAGIASGYPKGSI